MTTFGFRNKIIFNLEQLGRTAHLEAIVPEASLEDRNVTFFEMAFLTEQRRGKTRSSKRTWAFSSLLPSRGWVLTGKRRGVHIPTSVPRPHPASSDRRQTLVPG